MGLSTPDNAPTEPNPPWLVSKAASHSTVPEIQINLKGEAIIGGS